MRTKRVRGVRRSGAGLAMGVVLASGCAGRAPVQPPPSKTPAAVAKSPPPSSCPAAAGKPVFSRTPLAPATPATAFRCPRISPPPPPTPRIFVSKKV